MSDYAEVLKCFKEDDYRWARDLIEKNGFSPIILIAASYTKKPQKIGVNVTRALVEEAISCYAVWVFDEIINGENEPSIGSDIFDMIIEDIYACPGLETEDTEANRKELVHYIGTCSEPKFDEFLSFISRTSLVEGLSRNVILATIERAKRRLKDDRAFFLALYSAFVVDTLENLIDELNTIEPPVDPPTPENSAAERSIFEDLFAFEDEPLPDNPLPETPLSSSFSGVNWITEKSRRNYNRSYGRRRRQL